MIETRVGERQRDTAKPKRLLDRSCRRGIGTKAAAEPKQIAARVVDAVAGTFERHVLRQFDHLIDDAAHLQRPERGIEDRLLVAPFAMAEARQHRFAVEHDRGIGSEDQIRQGRHRIERIDLGAEPFDDAAEAVPLQLGTPVQILGAAGPIGRVHPGIDAVADREEARRAHQKARLRRFSLSARRVDVHRLFVVVLWLRNPVGLRANQMARRNLNTSSG